MKPIFITAIGTDIGKTVVSAILVEKLQSDYWKPIQSGDLDNSDTIKVRNLTSNNKSVFHQEAYRLTQPFSPHKSASIDGVTISLENFHLPKTDNRIIIEGAGGLMVPLNDRDYVVDLIRHLECEVVLVIKHYLGSINHTLLSLELLRAKNIPLKGLIFNGPSDSYSEQAISHHSDISVLGRVPQIAELTPQTITELARNIRLN